MNFCWLFYFTIVTFFVSGSNGQTRVAVALLRTDNINGSITFTEVNNGLHVNVSITGLPQGAYGFHIHELGDISTCLATGAHFELEGNHHGGRDHDVRHVGDLGNVRFVGSENGVANEEFVDSRISLRGRYSILGRAVVLHEQEDDLGLGGDDASLATGNAGARLACGVIGIQSPSDPWNSAITAGPSSVLLVFVAFILYTNL